MESLDLTQTQTDASAARKRRRGEENDVPPPSVQHAGNAQPRRPLAALGAARDAGAEPQREIIELSDDERDTLRSAQLALREAKAKAPKVAEAPSDRKQRAAARAVVRGHEAVDVDAHAAAAVAAASAPWEGPSEANGQWRARWPTDATKVVYLETDEQRQSAIKFLESVKIGDSDGLNLADDVVNTVSRLYFDNREVLGPLECCNDMREAALTKASWNRLINKILRYVRDYDPERAGPEPAHGPILRQMWAELQKVGITTSGNVKGQFAGLGVEGVYHYCHGNGKKATLSKASSLFHKLWIVTATRGKLDPIVKGSVDCSFGNATANSGEIGTLRTMEQGSFTGAKRGVEPLCKRYLDPQLGRAANAQFYGDGPVPRGTRLLIGNFDAAVIGHAIKRGCIEKYARCPSPIHFNLRRDGVVLRVIDAAWSSKTRVERAPLRDDLTVVPRSSDASTSATSIF
jgi:hypothetical protein